MYNIFYYLKGIEAMTAKEVAVRAMTEDDFLDVPKPGDQVIQFILYRCSSKGIPKNHIKYYNLQ